jgi:hypothetical protein
VIACSWTGAATSPILGLMIARPLACVRFTFCGAWLLCGACGGRTEFDAQDGLTGGAASGTGGAATATTGGATASSGCGPCDAGLCPSGTHPETPVGACCPDCVPDPIGACAQGQNDYAALHAQLLDKYGSTGCSSSSDCLIVVLDSLCGVSCGDPLPITASVSYVSDLTSMANSYCASCAIPDPVFCERMVPACVKGKCVAVDPTVPNSWSCKDSSVTCAKAGGAAVTTCCTFDNTQCKYTIGTTEFACNGVDCNSAAVAVISYCKS